MTLELITGTNFLGIFLIASLISALHRKTITSCNHVTLKFKFSKKFESTMQIGSSSNFKQNNFKQFFKSKINFFFAICLNTVPQIRKWRRANIPVSGFIERCIKHGFLFPLSTRDCELWECLFLPLKYSNFLALHLVIFAISLFEQISTFSDQLFYFTFLSE